MAIRRTSPAPKARLTTVSNPKQLQGFSPDSLGQCCPGHCPAQPGALVREQRPFPGASGRALSSSGGALGRPLDIAQVAAIIGCSPWTIRQTLIPRGLPHFRFKASGRLTFYESQIVRWIEKEQGGTTTK
jgi:hypothetical protein